MSKSIADKADVGSIIVRICDEEKSIIEPICQGLGLPMPTHVIDVYKNRRSEYNQIKIWCKIDLGTCREYDLLITTGYYEPIQDFNMLVYNYSSKENQNNMKLEDEVVIKEEKNVQVQAEEKLNEHDELPPFDFEESKDKQVKSKKENKFLKKGRLADLL